MRHSTVSKAPCQLGKDLYKSIWSVSIHKRVQISTCTAGHAALGDQVCKIAWKQEICHQRNHKESDEHQGSLYKVCYTYRHKAAHEGVAKNNCSSNGKCYVIIKSKYGIEQLTACCQRRSCIHQEKDYDYH